jgi:hypothetical protein
VPASQVTRYEVRAVFQAPVPFVFGWCTDYSPEDPRLEKDRYTRRIIERSARRVVYEDLYDNPDGWHWSRQVVDLRPPTRWHAVATGNRRTWVLDYELTELPGDRTELRLRGDRRATRPGDKNPPKATLERELTLGWANFARALERDYRASRRSA